MWKQTAKLSLKGVFLPDRWHQSGEGMDSTIHLQTFLLQFLHLLLPLPGDPTYVLGSRDSKMEPGSPPKKGQAVLPAWWGIEPRTITLQQDQCLDCKSTANCSTVVQIMRSAQNSFLYGHCKYIDWLIIYRHTHIYTHIPVIYRLRNTIDYWDI